MNVVTPTPPSPAEAVAHVEAVVKRAGSSFYTAMRLLPEEKRRAMFAVYAFCREVDDIADEPGEYDDKLAQLGQWRGEIERLYGGRPRHPIACALAGPLDRFGLRKEDFRAIIDGMEMDATPSVRLKDMAELTLYCDRVACAVGRLSNRVFGLDDDKSLALAAALGEALQLTNILRDIHEDAERNRLYLPADLLHSYDIDGDDLPTILGHEKLPYVCDVLAAVAENRFRESDQILSTCDRNQTRAAQLMMQVYRRVFERLTARGWRRMDQPVSLSRFEKAWVLLRYGIL
jgi:squalene synthase HpnD